MKTTQEPETLEEIEVVWREMQKQHILLKRKVAECHSALRAAELELDRFECNGGYNAMQGDIERARHRSLVAELPAWQPPDNF